MASENCHLLILHSITPMVRCVSPTSRMTDDWSGRCYTGITESFSMLRGLGLGNPMISRKMSSHSSLFLDTVYGLKPSRRLRRMRFFSST